MSNFSLREAMSELRRAGTPQNRKIYARHGVGEAMFGVSFAELGRLKKAIGVDTELARELWASENHDARVLAMMVIDPDDMTARELDARVKELTNYVVTDAFAKSTAKAPCARGRMDRWIKSRDEWISSCGWTILCHRAEDEDFVSDSELLDYLGVIEKQIHSKPNRTGYAMNGALIAMALRNISLQREAMAAARRIGTVEVDHGDTGCKTPDAVTMIRKAVEHRKKKAKKKAAKKKSVKKAAKKTGTKRAGARK